MSIKNRLKDKLAAKNASKVAKAVEVETVDTEVEDEAEVEETVVVKKAGLKKPLKRAPVPQDDEDGDDEDVEDMDDESVDEDDTDEDQDVDSEDDTDDEEVEDEVDEEVVAPVKKKLSPAAKKQLEQDEKDLQEVMKPKAAKPKATVTKTAEPKPKAKSSNQATVFNSKPKAAPKAPRVLAEGGIKTRDELVAELAQRLSEEQGVDVSLVDSRSILSAVEAVLLENAEKYSFNFMGVRFRRQFREEKLRHTPEGLGVSEDALKLKALTSAHYVTMVNIPHDKVTVRGDYVGDDFVEGKYIDGEFVEGVWSGTKTKRIFTPNETKTAVKKKKK